MEDYGYTNGRGRRGSREVWRTTEDGAEIRDGWSNSAYLTRVEVRTVIIGGDGRAMPGVIDWPNHHKDGTVTNGFPNKGGRYQSGSHNGGDKPRAQESINNVQNTAGDGGRTGFPAGIFRRQKFNYGGYEVGSNDMSDNGWNRPANGRYESSADNASTEPALITTGALARPNRTGHRNSALPNTYQPKKRDSATTTIDCREAAKKYGGMLV